MDNPEKLANIGRYKKKYRHNVWNCNFIDEPKTFIAM